VPLSYLRIEPDAVVIRRWPRREQRVPIKDVERFDVLRTKGEEDLADETRGLPSFFAPHDYLAVLLEDGGSMPVPGAYPDLAQAALRLNNQLALGG
jgi:hypothetical protein